MHPSVRARLDVFGSMDEIPGDVVATVADEIDRLDPAGRLDDEVLGSLVSHLVMALSRAVAGDTTVEGPAEAVYAEVLASAPEVDARATALAGRVSERLAVPVPEAERRFVAVHLAVVDHHQSKETP